MEGPNPLEAGYPTHNGWVCGRNKAIAWLA